MAWAGLITPAHVGGAQPELNSGALSMADDTNHIPEGSMEAQLASIYRERQMLQRELGTADASELIAMVRSFTDQLASLYAERQAASRADHAGSLAEAA
jgi:hypothetical protein